MGSVKDLVKDDSLAGKLFIPPTPHSFGRGAWKVSGRFSVGDLKGLIPPMEIEDKNFVLAMTASAYLESAANEGIDSCYEGMMNANGEVVGVRDLLDKGELSDVIVMKLANVPASGKQEDVTAYHKAIRDGDLTVYVADVEAIFRKGVPLGSSVFKKICAMADKGAEYEQTATYEQTVALLDEVRTGILVNGSPQIMKYLATLGLDSIPDPGAILPRPVFNFTTKFAESGDADITEEEVVNRLGGNAQLAKELSALLRNCTSHQIKYCEQKGIVNIDGKIEATVTPGGVSLTDFACTPDENRLMLRYTHKGTEYLLPTNKEIQRAIFRKEGIYDAIEKAKTAHGDKWKSFLLKYTTLNALGNATQESVELMASAIGTVGNRILGKTVFDAKPIDQWAPAFLPYASRVQK